MLPFGVISRIKIYENIYVYPIDFVVGSIFLLTLYSYILKKQKVLTSSLLKTVSAFFAVGFVSLLLNAHDLTLSQILISFSYSLRFAAYVSIIFACVFLTTDYKKKIPSKMMIAGCIFVFFGFLQYFYYSDLRNLYYLGWDQHLYRMFSTFLDPNFAGALFVLVLLLIVEFIIGSKHRKNTISLSFLGVFATVAIYLTYSRSAFIMLIVGLSMIFIFHKLYKHIFLMLVICSFLLFSFANMKIEGLNPLRIASSEARLRSAREAIDIFTKNPILGVGFNSYRYAQVENGARSQKGILISNADATTDNSLLFVLATTGIVGFGFFAKFWITVVSSVLDLTKKGKEKNLAILVVSSLAALFIDSLFINSLFYIFIMAWIFILLGTVLSCKSST